MSNRPVCIVTGGTSGIGLATAERFADAGYNLALCARNEERLDKTASELSKRFDARVHHAVADLSLAGHAQSFVEESVAHFGRLDVLVNNAGLAPNSPVESFSSENFNQVLSVNVAAVFETVRAAWPTMKQAGRGVIINISSLAAVDPFPGFSVYGGTKAFVETFTHAIANEGKDSGIRAYCVRPGAVDTPLLDSLFPDFPTDQRVASKDVAALILNLCSDEMRYSSGEAITIKK
jgi:NAD(P)-dependent dehydrogenase (short-subunit alcohol dehydrogenase family)